MKTILATAVILGVGLAGGVAFADHHKMGGDKMAMDKLSVSGMDQDVSGGTVTAAQVVAEKNGWLVVHRTGDDSKPGPVVGYAPLKAGANSEVVALLTEPVKPGEKLMLMLHGEDGGAKTGIFEYTLGAKEDGPVRVDGNLVMTVITAK